jgi:hypothetical protein
LRIDIFSDDLISRLFYKKNGMMIGCDRNVLHPPVSGLFSSSGMMLEEKLPFFAFPWAQNYHWRSFLKTKFGRSANSEHSLYTIPPNDRAPLAFRWR